MNVTVLYNTGTMDKALVQNLFPGNDFRTNTDTDTQTLTQIITVSTTLWLLENWCQSVDYFIRF